MLILGLDFETTFTDPIDVKEARIIEIGAVLWCTERNYPVLPVTRLVWAEGEPGYNFDPRINDLTGLTHEDLKEFGSAPGFALGKLVKLMKRATAIVAHNGKGFDKPVLEAEAARYGITIPELPWIDTTSDVPYPKSIETRKLKFLGPEHGFLNPYAHRAVFDVLTMLKVMAQYDFQGVFKLSKEPDVLVRAMIRKPFGPTEAVGKKEVADAKARGYRFDKALGDVWVKRIKESQYADEATAAPFQVVMIKDAKNGTGN